MKTSKAKTSAETTALSARTAAVQILFQVLEQGKSLSSLLPDAQIGRAHV